MAMTVAAPTKGKAYKGIGMEGFIARWYARNTKGALAEFRALAERIAERLSPGACVLEVAPGPGYLAVELARRGLRVTGIDISRSFVEIARANAAEAKVSAEFRVGNASALPAPDNWFDFLVTRAAFKNFADPAGAIREMHRVLRPGATALIVDMRKEASNGEIAEEVSKMNLGFMGAMFARAALRSLRGRAYSRRDFERMIAQTAFGEGKIHEGAIGFEIYLSKSAST